MLRDASGNWMEEEAQIKSHASNFFTQLYMEEDEHASYPTTRYGFSPLESSVGTDLDVHVTEEEIDSAIFSMQPWKAPGPDGFQAGFYHMNWALVRSDCYNFVKEVWVNPSRVASINATDICLIPKVPKPEFITQFRPISLCNVSYKIITKIIVNRLKPLMPTIISPYQTGFIPTRSIHENIIVAQELLHSMSRMKGRTGFCAIKVDLAKAYDRIRWSFIANVLREIGLPSRLQQLIMTCVSTVNSNVLWNGRRSDSFVPQRGIRQGDPMSPYLFVMCMDKLTHLIEEAVDNKGWFPIRAGRSGPNISHLMFADDLLLFGKATEDSLRCVMEVLNRFCSMSGQMVSLEKTSIFFSKNVSSTVRRRLSSLSGYRAVSSLGKYLGIPLLGRAPKKQDFHYLIDNVNQKLSGWKATHLSFAGRVTLAKSVIQAIPTYTMMTTPVPKSCLNEIEQLQRGFIWGDSVAGRKLHLVKWDTLLLPKSHGGLGLRSLGDMNTACLMKLAWSLKPDENKLWSRVLIAKYGRDAWSHGHLVSKTTDSYIWKAIVSCWEDIQDGKAWAIGDGHTVNFWQDKWLDKYNSLDSLISNIPADVLQWKVVDGVDDRMNWKVNILQEVLPGNLIDKLIAMPVPDPRLGADSPYWAAEKSGKFSVSSAYHFVRDELDSPTVSHWKLVWRLDVPERVRSFAWQIMHGKLPTKVYCRKWCDSSTSCHYCSGAPETILHVLRDCPRAFSVWRHLVPAKLRANFFGHAFDDWVILNVNYYDDHGWKNTWAVCCYFFWKWRNLEVHDVNYSRPINATHIIRQYVQRYLASKKQFNPSQTGTKVQMNICWTPSQLGGVTINTDGAAKSTGSGCGGVLRALDGSWLGGFIRYLGDASPFVAELWGACEGLKLAKSMGFTVVELQMDSKAAVLAIAGGANGNIDGRALLASIRRMLDLDWEVKVTHVYREANSVADGLAALACASQEGLKVLDQPPADVLHLLHSDCIGVVTPRLVTV